MCGGLAKGYVLAWVRLRVLGISGTVPLSLQKNAKGGEQAAQLADAQTSAACPPTHSPASQEEARLPAQSVRARRLTGAVRWRFGRLRISAVC